ncbi:MAG: PHB depolymerase family esterase, partial [Propionicimonas sp.]
PAPASGGTVVTLAVDGREFGLTVPPGYAAGQATGLVIGLHGYTADSSGLDSYFGLSAETARRGLLLALPQGLVDEAGDRFWNATPDCCDFYHSGVDDSAFLSGLIEEVGRAYAVDPRRVFVLGHSNGGFMAHRLACDHAGTVTGIMSLAGVEDPDPESCAPSSAVAVLQVHGTADEQVPYAGTGEFPSAADTVTRWAALDGCAAEGVPARRRDLDTGLPGHETAVTAWSDCTGSAGVELWTIEGGGHVPQLPSDFAAQVLDWLEAHTG